MWKQRVEDATRKYQDVAVLYTKSERQRVALVQDLENMQHRHEHDQRMAVAKIHDLVAALEHTQQDIAGLRLSEAQFEQQWIQFLPIA